METLFNLFRDPPKDFRRLPLLHKINPNRFRGLATTLQAQGVGGVVLQCGGQGEHYLVDSKEWQRFSANLTEAKKKGLLVWIYDEDGYPSGYASERTMHGHPEYEARGLYVVNQTVLPSDPHKVEIDLPSGSLYYAAALKSDGSVVDLTSRSMNSKLLWTAPPGQWKIFAFVETPLYQGTPGEMMKHRCANIMDRRAIARFIRLTHQAYYERYSSDFGKTIRAFFTDEPALVVGYVKEPAPPYATLPWSFDLADVFLKRNEYPLKEALPALVEDIGPRTAQIRCDFYSTVAYLVSEAYFKQIGDWCRTHNVAFSGHMLWEESLLFHVPFESNIFECLKWMDIPGMDQLGCTYGATGGSRIGAFNSPVVPKLVSSVAHLYGKPRTMTETFACTQPNSPFDDIISMIDWQAVLGINTFTTYLSIDSYTPDQHRIMNDRIGRLCFMLSQGVHVPQAAVYYPIESAWSNYRPVAGQVWDTSVNPEVDVIDRCFREVSSRLLSLQRDFDYIDAASLVSSRIIDRSIEIAAERFPVLILPRTTIVPLDVARKVVEFYKAGGTIIAVDVVPKVLAGSRKDQDLLNKIIPASVGKVRMNEAGGRSALLMLTSYGFNESLSQMIPPGPLLAKPDSQIYYLQRRTETEDIYFFLNNASNTAEHEITIECNGTPSIWDLNTGRVRKLKNSRKNRRSVTFKINLPGRLGVLVMAPRMISEH